MWVDWFKPHSGPMPYVTTLTSICRKLRPEKLSNWATVTHPTVSVPMESVPGSLPAGTVMSAARLYRGGDGVK